MDFDMWTNSFIISAIFFKIVTSKTPSGEIVSQI